MKKTLLILLYCSILSCTTNNTLIHKKTGQSIKVLDGISLKKARQVIDYVYKNFKNIELKHLNKGDFKYLESISLWNKAGEIIRNKKCKYSVDFNFPSTFSPPTGANLCIEEINNQLKLLASSHWQE